MTRLVRFFRLSEENPFTGWHMLAVTLLFFGTIITVNVFMAMAATSTFPGLSVANSYVSSQNYNELLAAARSQEQAGWNPVFAVRQGVLGFELHDAAGTPSLGLSVAAHVGRPGTEAQDREIAFAAAGAGYLAEAPLPPGRWEVDLEARRGDRLVFRETREIFVSQDGAGR
ncbi:FixH family protein [Propylenella binzhouense]|uniref:Nitrogen fixation protein FixH n=1 Tax=Propylenella binzhouense TaxID=2555902 RepID=A0A964T6D3_9HYPH|nr:FixH family protein [Propylenella binzhouense]MYZ48737.1 hypothetical protein [Propylenella binzhouense]